MNIDELEEQAKGAWQYVPMDPADLLSLVYRIRELEGAITDLIRDREDTLDSDKTKYFWNKARAALHREMK